MTMNDASNVQCVGIIMDGNRRWAKARGLPTLEGHSEGRKKLQEFMRWAHETDIPHVVAYAFSTENWQRSKEEVAHLMKLFHSVLENETEKIIKERMRVRFVGDRSRFDKDLQKMMAEIEETTSVAYDITLHLLMSYGGRAEVIAAVNTLLVEGTPDVTEEEFSRKLWSYPMPDPDFIIRTGGQIRLSNFLPWQSVYSELFFTDTLWPDFTKEEFERMVTAYHTRKRNFGT